MDGWFLDVGQDQLPARFQSLRVEAISDSGDVLRELSPPRCWHCFRRRTADNFSIPWNQSGVSLAPGSRLQFPLGNSATELGVNLVFCLIFSGLCPLLFWHYKHGKVVAQMNSLLVASACAALLATSMTIHEKRNSDALPQGWIRVLFLNGMLALMLCSQSLQKIYQHLLWFCGLVDVVALAWELRSSTLRSFFELQEIGLCAFLIGSGVCCA